MSAADTLATIVLAAGSGTRYGGAKQLALVDGVPLVRRAAELAHALCPGRVVLVTGAYAAAVAATVADLPVGITHNPHWDRGLAGSLHCGLDAMAADTAACLVLLADQSAVTGADLQSLASAWRAAPAIPAAAEYGGGLGVPAIFPRRDWPALRALTGDRGARALLAALPLVTPVPMPHALVDIDTPADLGR